MHSDLKACRSIAVALSSNLRPWFFAKALCACAQRALLYPLCLVLLAACTTPFNDRRNDQHAVHAEEQAVYEAIFGCKQYPDSHTLIAQQTDVSDTASIARVASADWETIADLQAKSSQSYTLDPWIPATGGCVLLSQATLDALYAQGDFWTAFHAQYGDGAGIQRVSRVGFNHTLDQAVVYRSGVSGLMRGAGSVVVLVKQHGQWIQQSETGLWVS